MYSLKHLILADNSLSMLTGFTQAKFPNLVSLDLCNNKLSQLDINSDLAMSHLQKLMLRRFVLIKTTITYPNCTELMID